MELYNYKIKKLFSVFIHTLILIITIFVLGTILYFILGYLTIEQEMLISPVSLLEPSDLTTNTLSYVSVSNQTTVLLVGRSNYFDFFKSLFLFSGSIVFSIFIPSGLIFVPINLFITFWNKPKLVKLTDTKIKNR